MTKREKKLFLKTLGVLFAIMLLYWSTCYAHTTTYQGECEETWDDTSGDYILICDDYVYMEGNLASKPVVFYPGRTTRYLGQADC